MTQFQRWLVGTIGVPLILGICTGVLYAKAYVTSTGWWVDVLTTIARMELDKQFFPYIFGGSLYLAVWGLLGKLRPVYKLGLIGVVKGFLGVAAIAIYVLAASPLIPAFASMRALATSVATVGLVSAWVWNYLLTPPDNHFEETKRWTSASRKR